MKHQNYIYVFNKTSLMTGVVPKYLSEVPDEPLFMMVGDIKVHPGSYIETSQVCADASKLLGVEKLIDQPIMTICFVKHVFGYLIMFQNSCNLKNILSLFQSNISVRQVSEQPEVLLECRSQCSLHSSY